MLPAPHRLRLPGEFEVATRRGRRAGSGTVVVHLARPTTEADVAGGSLAPPRVGFVVSRACGPAVLRNRVRRRLRHLMAATMPALPPGAMVVVRALPTAASASSQLLAGDVDRCLAKLRTARALEAGP